MSNPLGRPMEPVQDAWARRFNIRGHLARIFTPRMCWQLCRCKSDAARRMILGVSK